MEPKLEILEDPNGGRLRQDKPWLECAGELSGLHQETSRINKMLDEEFGQFEPRRIGLDAIDMWEQENVPLTQKEMDVARQNLQEQLARPARKRP